MADSSLSSAGGTAGGSFSQQGSVDWVALSGSTLSFSVEMLSRFSKAGVEMITVAMGQSLFSKFDLKADGQKRFSDAIAQLKAVSSYGKVLWFGFGVKHIIRTLSETEQGTACAAICACLSVSFDNSYGSRVLKAMADIQKAPMSITPSLSQWSALLKICAGGVTDSKFPLLVEGFSHLLESSKQDGIYLHQATPPEALAGALIELAKVSNGSLQSIKIVGGIDCSWLVAIAEWVLSLRAEIIDQDGGILYSTQGNSRDRHAQVTFVRLSSQRQQSGSLLSRSFVVPPGELCDQLVTKLDARHEPMFSRGRAAWSSVLRSAFGKEMIDRILDRKNISIFAQFLCVSNDLALRDEHGRQGFHPLASLNIGQVEKQVAWLHLASNTLPELSVLGHKGFFFYDSFDREIDLSCLKTRLRIACCCPKCNSLLESKNARWQLRRITCLFETCLAIAKFIWILSWISVDNAISPSIDGLRALYTKFAETSHHLWPRASKEPEVWDSVELTIFLLFTGHIPPDIAPTHKESARSVGGICLFLSALRDPTTCPQSQFLINVMPGHIQKDDVIYDRITDVKRSYSSDPFKRRCFCGYVDVTKPITLALVVEETLDARVMEAEFQIRYRGHLEKSNTDARLEAFGPTQIRTRLIERHYSQACTRTTVVITPPRLALSTNTLWTSPWIGKCFEASSELWTMPDGILTYDPKPDEWLIITSLSDFAEPTSVETVLIRGDFPLLYALLCQDRAGFANALFAQSSCLPCLVLGCRSTLRRGRFFDCPVTVCSGGESPWQMDLAEEIRADTSQEGNSRAGSNTDIDDDDLSSPVNGPSTEAESVVSTVQMEILE